jgi:hypothetical protein
LVFAFFPLLLFFQENSTHVSIMNLMHAKSQKFKI